MITKTFECPGCAEHFRVPLTHSTQVVGCPHCGRKVKIPSLDNAELQAESPAGKSAPAKTPSHVAQYVQPDVRQCVVCEGKFRITAQMVNAKIACPHCQQVLTILPEPDRPKPSPVMPPSEENKPVAKDSAPPEAQPRESAPKSPLNETARENSGAESVGRTNPPRGAQEGQASTRPSTGEPTVKEPTRDEPEHPPAAMHSEAMPADSSDRWRAPPEPVDDETVGPDASAPRASASALGIPAFDVETPEATDDLATADQAVGRTPDAPATGVPPDSPATDGASTLPLALMPPVFDVYDPERVSYRQRQQSGKVILPDAESGEREVDERIVHVWHNGEWVPLVARTPEERARYRFWVNLISMGIGLLFVVVAILLLLA